MGFYSIYKIIKDIIRTLFGNKFLKLFIIIAIIFTFLFIYSEKAFCANAFTISYTLNGNTKNITVDDELLSYKYVFLYASGSSWSNQGEIRFIATDIEPSFDYVSELNKYRLIFHFNSGDERYVYSYSGNIGNIASNLTINKSNATFLTTSSNLYMNITINDTSYNYGYSHSYSYLSTFDVVINNQSIFTTNYSTFINPSLSNTQSELENLSFNNFTINANSYTDEIENSDGTLFMLFYNRSLSNSNNIDGLYPIKEKGFTKGSIYTDTTNSTSSNMIFNYPIFQSGVFFNIGSTYEIKFAYKTYNNDGTWQYNYFDNNYIFTISSNVTQDYINQLNQQTATSTDEENQQNIENAINNQTQSIDNINNTINNSNVDSSSINLPTDNTNDITQGNIDNIFQTIYNSFTSGTPQDIVFPIPFTNKNITLSPNYIYNSLSSNGASWIITLIQAFWWYIISRFIIKDIMSKIRKIKQGNFENIQNSNIREDML